MAKSKYNLIVNTKKHGWVEAKLDRVSFLPFAGHVTYVELKNGKKLGFSNEKNVKLLNKKNKKLLRKI